MGRGTAWGMTLDRACDWRDHAACSLDTAYLFELKATRAGAPPMLTATNRLALRLCETCPVQAPCLEAALADDDPWPRIAGGQVVEPAATSSSRARGVYRHRRRVRRPAAKENPQ